MIRIFTQARVTMVSGFIGNFDVRIAVEPNGRRLPGHSATAEIRASVGTIIMATGFRPL